MKRYIRANQISEYDSEGNELSPEQSAFFKDSKIRDSQGRLLVCYHSTYSDFEVFDLSKVGSGSGGAFGSGFYFTPTKSIAEHYGNIMLACYLNLTNPLNYAQYGTNKLILDLMQREGYQFADGDILHCDMEYSEDVYDIVDIIWDNGYSSSDFSNCLIHAGYDGILIDNEIVTFNPNQIKSITNRHPTNSSNINAYTGVIYE